jgi:hypothetical protein
MIRLLAVTLALCALPVLAQAPVIKRRTPMEASISRDGRQVVWVEELIDEGFKTVGSDLMVMNADGTGVRRLTQGFIDQRASFSPDGKKVVFTRRPAGMFEPVEVWIVGADGTGLTRLTNDKQTEQSPAFTADGLGILFTRDAPLIGKGGGIFLLTLSTGQERLLLGGEYSANLVGPLPGEQAAWAVTRKLLPDGKPDPLGFIDKVLVRVPFDGTVPRPMLLLPKPSSDRFQGYRVAGPNTLLRASIDNKPQSFLVKGTRLEPLPLEGVEDLAADGKRSVARVVNDDIEWEVVVQDLDQKTALGVYPPRKMVAKNPEPPVAPPPPTAPSPADFAKNLNALALAAPTDFKAVRVGAGELNGLKDTWFYNSSVELPGAEKMSIMIPVKPGNFNQPVALTKFYVGDDATMLEATYTRLLSDVKKALPGWKVEEETDEADGSKDQTAILTSAKVKTEIRIAASYSTKLKFGDVYLHINKVP